MVRTAAAVLVVLTATITAGGTRSVAAAPAPPAFAPPVDAPVVDPFRPPESPYGPGNRGLEYATTPAQEVRAIADGTVVFAGRVGATLHVTVLHAGGLRSSVSFLRTIKVSFGMQVRRGAVLGTAGPRLHLGVRRDGRYVDPAALFGARRERGRAVLVRGPRLPAFVATPLRR